MSKYPSTNITYSGLEDKGGPTITILDEKKNKWTIWRHDYTNKEDLSEAYATLQNYHIGESFGIEYGEKEESFTGKEGNLVKFTRRTIYKILPTVANPTQVTKAKESPRSEAPAASGRNWDQEAYEKCCSLWAAAIMGNRAMDAWNIEDEIGSGKFWSIFQAIKADGKKRFPTANEDNGDEAPPPQDIPF